jgi:AbrB family looped-hinge helix DNA binding protein
MGSALINERGQLTIPKKMREKANIKPNEEVTITVNNEGQIVISKRDFFDDLDDLIKRDLVNEGVAPYELEVKMIERKKELAQALNKIVDEAQREITEDKYSTYEELSNEIEKY